jgi:predicted DNA-binding transcriptional regulator YafY
VAGRKLNNGKIRIYSLDRMISLKTTDQAFEYPVSFNPEAYFFHCFGVIEAADELDVETIRLRVSTRNNKRDYFRSLPIHHSQKETEKQATYSIFEYRLYPTYDFFQEILSHGAEVEILSPQWVRNEYLDTVSELFNLYKNL